MTDTTQKFLNGTLSPEGFTHRHHVIVAFEILRDNDVFDALALYARGLRYLTQTAGVPQKFHATVTFAFISLIADRMEEGDHANADAFLADNPDLLMPGVLSPYYDTALLETAKARRLPLMQPHSAAQGA